MEIVILNELLTKLNELATTVTGITALLTYPLYITLSISSGNGGNGGNFLYNFYSLWAKERNTTRLSKTILGRNLEKYCPFLSAKKGSLRFWENVALKNIDDKQYSKDTLDALKNIYIQIQESNVSIVRDMIKKNASNPSSPKESTKDTLDAFSKKDEDLEVI